MKVHLVRHTSVELDGNYYCYGNMDVAVHESFPIEAAVTKSNLSDIHAEAVFTSPLSRAAMLADFCGYPKATRDARLKEMHFGEWEGRRWDTILPNGSSTGDFFLRYLHEPVPGGESLLAQQSRVENFLHEKKDQGLSSILVFCHGGVINCARASVGEFTLTEAFQYLPNFGSIHTLEI